MHLFWCIHTYTHYNNGTKNICISKQAVHTSNAPNTKITLYKIQTLHKNLMNHIDILKSMTEFIFNLFGHWNTMPYTAVCRCVIVTKSQQRKIILFSIFSFRQVTIKNIFNSPLIFTNPEITILTMSNWLTIYKFFKETKVTYRIKSFETFLYFKA